MSKSKKKSGGNSKSRQTSKNKTKNSTAPKFKKRMWKHQGR